jgi:hypothetical protein
MGKLINTRKKVSKWAEEKVGKSDQINLESEAIVPTFQSGFCFLYKETEYKASNQLTFIKDLYSISGVEWLSDTAVTGCVLLVATSFNYLLSQHLKLRHLQPTTPYTPVVVKE